MTISVTDAASGPYYPNGVTRDFPFDFSVDSGDEVRVVLIAADGTETPFDPALYAVTISTNGEGGTVRMAAPPVGDGRPLWVTLDPSFEQNILFEDEGPFNSAVLNPLADRAARRALWLRDRVMRAVQLPFGESPPLLAPQAQRTGGKVLGFNAQSGAMEVQGSGAFKGDPGGNAMAIGLFAIASTLAIPIGTDLVQTAGFAANGRGQARYAYDAAVDAAYVAANPRASFRSANGRGFRIVEPVADVMMFGAVANGVADDAPAAAAMVKATKFGFMPPGKYFFATPVMLNDGTVIYGAGTSAWEPYTGVVGGVPQPFPDVFRTEIVVDGTLAFNGAFKNSWEISAVAIKAKMGRMSAFGTAPNFQPGARGIDLTGSQQAQIDNISFHGLEVAVDGNQDAGLPAGSMQRAASAQMPSITRFMAADCGTVIRFGNLATAKRVDPAFPLWEDPNPYTVRDARIGECVIALHCGKMIDAHYCDGIRIENCRFFQAFSNTINIRKTPFVTISAVTCFENSVEQLVLKECSYVTIVACDLSRAGCYANANPGYPAFTALTLDSCEHVVFEGRITQPGGRPIRVVNSKNLYLAGSIFQAFWTNGNPTGETGSIDIRTSEAIELNIVESLGANYIGVWADEASAPTVNGTYATDGPQGCVRAYIGPKGTTFTFRNETAFDLGPGGTSPVFATPRIRLPAGKSLFARSVQLTCSGVIMRSGGTFWNNGLVADTDGGSVEYATKGLATNGGPNAGYVAMPLTWYNATGGVVTVPAGAEARLSFAIG